MSLADITRELHQAEEDEFNRVCGTSGWKLHNIPRSSPELWNELLDILGSGNYFIQTMSTGNFTVNPDGVGSRKTKEWVRGYILIGPKGAENMREYLKR